MESSQDQLSKEIWLDPEEIERMILGSLHWTDVAERLGRVPEKVPEEMGLGEPNYSRRTRTTASRRRVVEQNPDVLNSDVLDSLKSGYKPIKELEGFKVVLLLGGVALLTVATWAYFVFFR